MPSTNRRSFAPAFRLAITVVLVVLLTGACSGKSHKKTASPPVAQSTESGSATRRTHLLRIGTVALQRAGSRGSISVATRNEVLASAQRYVDRAILAPLETGRAGRGYPALFVAGLRPAATGVDTRVLTDLAVGNTATLVEKTSPVALSGLADQSGSLLYLATKFHVAVQATTGGGPMTINRTVELTYVRGEGTWLVTAYRVAVTRTRPATTKSVVKGRHPPTELASRGSDAA